MIREITTATGRGKCSMCMDPIPAGEPQLVDSFSTPGGYTKQVRICKHCARIKLEAEIKERLILRDKLG